MRTIRGAVAALALSLLPACADKPATPPPEPPPVITLASASFADLPGWERDDQAAALPAFLRSCARLSARPDGQAVGPNGLAGTIADWKPVCAAAARVPAGDRAAARAFLERHLRPWRAGNGGKAEGLFTGYYEPLLEGARVAGPRHPVPLLKRPPDLVEVDLGQFREALKGQRTAGRVENGRLRPYPSRAEIEDGALAGKGLELLWVTDPIDAFVLHIQGSGRVRLPDGSTVRVGYAGQNGHPYVALGRLLIDRGEMAREDVTMPAIRAWLAARPDAGKALMRENPSYVFFRELQGEGPLGAEGTALTAGRSLAVDPTFLAYGIPLWLDAEDPLDPAARVRRLMVAQDTGGAIRGPVRGDVFWGFGAEAAERAGRMKSKGGYWLLLPAGVTPKVG